MLKHSPKQGKTNFIFIFFSDSFQVGAESKNKELRPWVQHIINHFWYCCREANGDEDTLLVGFYGYYMV